MLSHETPTRQDLESTSHTQVTGLDHWFYEYHWDGPKRQQFPVWQPRQTTLFVVFDGEARHLFSTACIIFYYSKPESLKDARSNVWDIQPLGPVIHSFRGQVQHAIPNASTLPKLTIAFEVAVGQTSVKAPFSVLVLQSPTSFLEFHRDQSINVLLEHELPLTSDTLSLSLSFAHSTLLCTPVTQGYLERRVVPTHPVSQIEVITTRIVRVLPSAFARPRITDGRLPTELLVKTFQDAEFHSSWPADLLSFAQVCRAWSCAMHVLHSRLHFSDGDKQYLTIRPLHVYALAKALSEKPVLGRAFRQFSTSNLGESGIWEDSISHPAPPANPARFTAALTAILRTTKNVHRLHLERLDPRQSDELFAALRQLPHMRTFTIAETTRTLGVVQLARCMGRWPALTSLGVHHLHPGIVGIGNMWRFMLRPPSCALTQLVIGRSRVGDKDLLHLFSSSSRTLERVTLDEVQCLTNAGLTAFLLAIAQSVAYLTVRRVARQPFGEEGRLVFGSKRRREERALDVVVDKMPRLLELRISGDVASELMLDRRSKMFVACSGTEETRVPVVQLWCSDVRRLAGFFADERWPGWCTPDEVPQQ